MLPPSGPSNGGGDNAPGVRWLQQARCTLLRGAWVRIPSQALPVPKKDKARVHKGYNGGKCGGGKQGKGGGGRK
ncbi:Hypothetical predicted protein [Lecanosticta acicola]|uniref:Uncharacterized protein n=1 Tax=Lecanosticta acicola TaxID=111012 RepID=A0AAI9EB45_9PEZI|nr:Hypothetical predicted protein [Lecanosticta acicola]